MKLYEKCFDYKLDSEDVIVDSTWEIELDNFKQIFNPEEDFMEQLSRHKLFLLVCKLNDDAYVDKCYEIHSEVF